MVLIFTRTKNTKKELTPVHRVSHYFSKELVHRNPKSDYYFNAIKFRELFLRDLHFSSSWEDDRPYIILDFLFVEKISPSFANEAFAYFTKFAPPERVKNKIKFINISVVKQAIIDLEIEQGYKGEK